MRTRVEGGREHTAVPGTDVLRYRCSPVPLFPGTDVSGTVVPHTDVSGTDVPRYGEG
jgi:hypothetical protein